MPSWKIPAVPGYDYPDPLDVLNDDHLLGKADDTQSNNTTTTNTTNNSNNSSSVIRNTGFSAQDKPVGQAERSFHLSLGLADPRLQQGSQHLGFGSLDADSTGSLCEQELRSEL